MRKKYYIFLLWFFSVYTYPLTIFGQQINLALSASVTQSSGGTGAFGPSNYNDNVIGPFGSNWGWVSTNGSIEYLWTTPQNINKIVFYKDNRPFTSMNIEIWNGSVYVPLFTGYTGTTATQDSITFPTVISQRVRFSNITGLSPNFREIQVIRGSISNNDIGVATFDSISNICTTSPIPIYARVFNYGKNRVNSLSVNWSINGAIQPPVSWTGLLDTVGGSGSSSTVVLVGTYAFSGAFSTIRAWTSQPNMVADTVRFNDTSTIIRNAAFGIGTYTIGGINPDFATVTDAWEALKIRGICGPVTFLIRNGTYTEQLEFNQQIQGASAINTITFLGQNRNNTIIDWAAGTSTTARHTILINATRFLTFRNLTIQGQGNAPGQGSYTLIINGTASDIKVKGCNIRISGDDATISTATNYIPVLLGGTSSNYFNQAKVDRVEIDSNIITNGWSGYYHNSPTTSPSEDNTFIGNTVNNNVQYAFYASVSSNINVSGNTINLRSSATAASGIYVLNANPAVGKFVTISGNRIARFGFAGIYVINSNSPVTPKSSISNNAIGGENMQSNSYGILLQNSNGFMIHHNSILLATPGSTSLISSPLYITGGSGNSVINNHLARFGAGTGLSMYITLASSIDTMDNNNFFKTDTSTGLLYIGATRFPSNFIGYLGFNTNSLNRNPDFVSETDLNTINPCNNGMPIASVRVDITGRLRNLTAPDIGAYELPSTNNDLQVTQITSLGFPLTAGFNDMVFRVRNNGANTITSFEAGYTHNAGPANTQTVFHTLTSCDTVSVVFSGSQQIFITNINEIKAYSASPNSGIDSNRVNDTLFRVLYLPLNGTYTIGGVGANFSTISQAMNTLQVAGISGPTEFVINPGTYLERVTLTAPINGLSAATPITIRGVSRDLVSIEGSIQNQSVVSIIGVNYVTIRDVTIINYASTGTCLAFIGNSLNNSVTGSTVANCRIHLPNFTTGTGNNILFTSNSNAVSLQQLRADSITIDSNICINGSFAVAMFGNANTSFNRNILVRNNHMIGHVTYAVYFVSIFNPIQVTSNFIQMNVGQGGIFLTNCAHNNTVQSTVVAYNRILNHGGYGIYLTNPTSNSTSVAPTLIFNNFVSSSITGNTIYSIGVFDQSNSRTWIYHNNVLNLSPTVSTNSACFFSSGSALVEVKNNIFTTLFGATLPIVLNTNPGTGNINHNMYFNAISANLGRRGGTTFTTTNFKTSTTGGDSSHNLNPEYVSNTDLHVQNTCTPRGIDLTSIIPLDIDSTPRISPPMIGADELATFSNDIQAKRLITPVIPVDTGLQEVKLIVKNSGSTTISSFDVSYRFNGGVPVTVSYSGPGLLPCEEDTIEFTGTNRLNIPNGVSSFSIYTQSPNGSFDGNPLNDTISLQLKTPMNGTYILGFAPADYFDINDALADAKTRGLSGPITLAIKSGVYTNNYLLDDIPGVDDNNTITITSLANNRDSVVLQFPSATGMSAQVINITGKYYIIQNLTIRQLNGNAANRVITFNGTPSFVTIQNCNIRGPIFGVDGVSTQSYTVFANGINCTDITFRNNYLCGSHFGFQFVGNNLTYGAKNLVLESNLIDSASLGGIAAIQNTSQARILNNTINYRLLSTTFSNANLFLQNNDTGFLFSGNRINSVVGKSVSLYIYFSRNTPTNPSVVSNNIFNTSLSNLNVFVGINNQISNLTIANNTFHLGTGNIQFLTPGGFSQVKFLNNIVAGNGSVVLQLSNPPTSPSQLAMDHNLYHSYNSSTPISLTGTPRTLSLFKQLMPGFETNGLSYRPPFVSNTNPSINVMDSAIWLINARASTLLEVPFDINGIPRPLNAAAGAADIGALEIAPGAGVVSPIIIPNPVVPVLGGTQHFVLGEDTVARIRWDSIAVTPSLISMRFYPGRFPDTQGANGTPGRLTYELSATGNARYTLTQCFEPNLLGNITSISNVRSSSNSGAGWNSNTGTLSTVFPLSNFCTTPNLSQLNAVFTLTDNTSPLLNFLVITRQPANAVRCAGDSALFIASATGSAITYQWQELIAGTWTPISGAIDDTLRISAITNVMNGRSFRCAIGSAIGSALTQSATLTVGQSTIITVQPNPVATCVGENAVFNVIASGSLLTYQWQVNTGSGFTNISGANQATYVQSFVTSGLNNNQYRCIVTGTCGTVISSQAALTVNSLLTILTQPQPTSILACAGGSATITVSATGATSFQWQVNTGSGFQNITGGTDDTLQLTNIPANYQGATIRCAIANTCDLQFTNSVSLTVEIPGVWTGNTNTNWSTASNWGCGQVPNLTSNVTISSTAMRMPVISSSVFINNLTIQPGASLSIKGTTGILQIVGNLINNGNLLDSGGTLVMNGISAQTLQAGNYSGKLRINAPAGVTLTQNLVITDTLTFITGRLILGNFNVTIGTSAAITGASNTSYIVTNGTGSLIVQNIGAGGKTANILFPVGFNTTQYNPVTLSNSGTSDQFSVRVINGAFRSYSGSNPVIASQVTSSVVGASWIISEGTAGGSNANLEFQWDLGQELSGFIRLICYVTRYNLPNWITGPTGSASGPFVGPYSRSISGVTAFSVFNIASGTALPVTLTHWSGKAVGYDSELEWVTSSEQNNSHFWVERSLDNINFTRIGKVATQSSNGNSNTILVYTYTDPQALKHNSTVYYRLVQYDADGKENQSPTIQVNSNQKESNIGVHPNPFTSQFVVEFQESDHIQELIITDIAGNTLWQEKVESLANSKTIQIKDLSPGLYFLHVGEQVIKIVKQ